MREDNLESLEKMFGSGVIVFRGKDRSMRVVSFGFGQDVKIFNKVVDALTGKSRATTLARMIEEE